MAVTLLMPSSETIKNTSSIPASPIGMQPIVAEPP